MSQRRVLIVDDDCELADLITRLLVANGIAARYVADSRLAMTVAEEFRPDAAIVDLRMPAPDGLEIIRRMRSAFSSLLIVVHSGCCEQPDREEARLAGANNFIAKPAKIDELLAALSAIEIF